MEDDHFRRRVARRVSQQKKNGELFWELASIAPVKDGETITNFVGVKEDITERKAMEEQFRQSQKMEAVGPAHRRHRARFQQPSCHHHRQSAAVGASQIGRDRAQRRRSRHDRPVAPMGVSIRMRSRWLCTCGRLADRGETELAEPVHQLYPEIKVLFTTRYAGETTRHERGLHERAPWLLEPYSHQTLLAN